jgi:excisionase family DNA binding protein
LLECSEVGRETLAIADLPQALDAGSLSRSTTREAAMATARKVRRAREREEASEQEQLLTVKGIAKRLNVSEATAHRHLPRMRIIRFGRLVRARPEDVDAYAASLIREPTQPNPPRNRRRYGAEQRTAGAS